MSRLTRKISARNPISDRKFHRRKTIRGIAKLWADDEDEMIVLCSIGGVMLAEDRVTYNHFRSHCIEREVNKCISFGLITNGEKIAAMLTSPDIEMSQMGMDIVYTMREKRLKIINETVS